MTVANGTTPDHRTIALTVFAASTGFDKLARILQRGRDIQTARFSIQLHDQRVIRIGNADTLWSYTKFSQVMAVALSAPLEYVKPSDWREIVNGLIAAATDVEEPTGESYEDTVTDWLRKYARGALRSRDHAAPSGEPFEEDGHLHISANEFAKHVRRDYSEQVKISELRQALGDLGYERITVMYARPGGKRSSTSYYRGPLEQEAEA